MNHTVYVTGLDGAPDSLPGIGVARSLKSAFADTVVVGVGFRPDSAGLSWEGFDRIVVRPESSLTTAGEHAAFVTASTRQDAFWMSCLDSEIGLLAGSATAEEKILAPLRASRQGFLARPQDKAAAMLGLSRPRFIRVPCTDRDAHHFLSSVGWKARLTSRHHGAFPCRSWQEYRSNRLLLDRAGGASPDWFLEEDVAGAFESVSFCAYAGKLLDACALVRTQTTAEGKLQGGTVLKLNPATWSKVSGFCAASGWTGGAELECIRHASGRLHLVDMHPGFPDWIHAGTLAGHNLPALLVGATGGAEAPRSNACSASFVRIVMEVPRRTDMTAGDPNPHPSGTALPSRAADEQPPLADPEAAPAVPAALVETLRDGHQATPFYWLDREAVSGDLVAAGRKLTQSVGRHGRVHIAYSCKTNPDFALLKRLAATGSLVDTISAHEIERCLQAGFDPQRLILNGPAKFWPRDVADRLGWNEYFAVNCDSRVELARVCESLVRKDFATKYLGLRIRPFQTPSRFGMPSDVQTMDAVAGELRKLPALPALALHFHFSPWFLGPGWFGEVESVSRWISEMARQLPSTSMRMFDFGGGFSERQLSDEAFLAALERCASGIAQLGITDFVFELGRSVVQSHGSYVSRVLEVRAAADAIEVVCDGAITNIGDHYSHPKSIAFLSGATHEHMTGRGCAAPGILLGRTCMEGDILRTGFVVPEGLSAGDHVVIGDCGAYDISMAQQFGLGDNSGAAVV